MFENVQNMRQIHKLHDESHGKLKSEIRSWTTNHKKGKEPKSNL